VLSALKRAKSRYLAVFAFEHRRSGSNRRGLMFFFPNNP